MNLTNITPTKAMQHKKMHTTTILFKYNYMPDLKNHVERNAKEEDRKESKGEGRKGSSSSEGGS